MYDTHSATDSVKRVSIYSVSSAIFLFHLVSQSLTLRVLRFAMASRPRTRHMRVESTDKRERRCKYPTRDPETFFKIVLNEKILVCVFCSLKLFWVILWFSVLFLNETLWGLLRRYVQVLHCLFLWIKHNYGRETKNKDCYFTLVCFLRLLNFLFGFWENQRRWWVFEIGSCYSISIKKNKRLIWCNTLSYHA